MAALTKKEIQQQQKSPDERHGWQRTLGAGRDFSCGRQTVPGQAADRSSPCLLYRPNPRSFLSGDDVRCAQADEEMLGQIRDREGALTSELERLREVGNRLVAGQAEKASQGCIRRGLMGGLVQRK
jgi:hypothetical protein